LVQIAVYAGGAAQRLWDFSMFNASPENPHNEQTSAVQGFETAERAHLAHAIDRYAKARADAEAAATHVRRALAAVARSEGGEDADPARWGALLTSGTLAGGP
jgi:hypothetical protein